MADHSHQTPSQDVAPVTTDTKTAGNEQTPSNSAVQGQAAATPNPNDEFGLLSQDPTTQASELYDAIGSANMPEIYRILGGPNNRAVKAAYPTNYGNNVEDDIVVRMSGSSCQYALAFAKYGTIDLKSRIRAVTKDIWGSDPDKVFELLESAPPKDLWEVAHDPDVTAWLVGELNSAQYTRAMSALEPYREAMSEEQKKTVFAHEEKIKGLAADQAPLLLTKLKARKGWVNDDEDGMMADVKAFASAVGAQTVDGDKVDSALQQVLDWLKGELSDRQFLEAKNTIRAGGSEKRSLDDKISEASADRNFLGFKDTDEEAIYTAIQGASQEDRDATDLTKHSAAFDASELEQAKAQMGGPEGAGAEGFKMLMAAVSGMWIADNDIFVALEKMSSADLIKVRRDATLVSTIQAGLSAKNVERFNGIIGWSGEEATGTDEVQAKELAKSDERMVSRMEEAIDHWDWDNDKVYVAIIDWQKAGGKMTRDSTHWGRAHSVIWYFYNSGYYTAYEDFKKALLGQGTLTHKDRLRHATADGLGTDDTAVDKTMDEVPHDELVRDWSNLPTFKAESEGLQEDALKTYVTSFVVDLDPQVMAYLEGDRWHTTDERGKLRDRLVAAMETEAGKKIALDEFGYTVDPEALLKLRYRQAKDVFDDSRGGLLNGLMNPIYDDFSGRGTEEEWAYGTYQGHAEDTLAQEDDSKEQKEGLETTEEKRQEFLTASQAYDAVKSSVATVASGIVSVIVGAAITIASGGTAAPAAYALLAGLSGALAGEVTKAAMQGGTYDYEQGAQDLAVAFATSIIAMPLGGAADALGDGLKPTALKLVDSTLLKQYPALAKGLGGAGKRLIEAGVKDFPINYAKEAVNTEGLLREGLGGALEVAGSTFQDAAKDIVTSAFQQAIYDNDDTLKALKHSGEWDQYADELVKKGLIDMGVALASEKIMAGEMPSAKDLVSIMGKIAATCKGAPLKADAAKLDAAQTLAFFNTASIEDLKKVHGVGDSIADRIRKARSGEKFTTIDQLIAIPYFTEEVLTPAAMEIRDAYIKERDAARASASGSGS